MAATLRAEVSVLKTLTFIQFFFKFELQECYYVIGVSDGVKNEPEHVKKKLPRDHLFIYLVEK